MWCGAGAAGPGVFEDLYEGVVPWLVADMVADADQRGEFVAGRATFGHDGLCCATTMLTRASHAKFVRLADAFAEKRDAVFRAAISKSRERWMGYGHVEGVVLQYAFDCCEIAQYDESYSLELVRTSLTPQIVRDLPRGAAWLEKRRGGEADVYQLLRELARLSGVSAADVDAAMLNKDLRNLQDVVAELDINV